MTSRRPSLLPPGRESHSSSLDGRRRSSVRLSNAQLENMKTSQEEQQHQQAEGAGDELEEEEEEEEEDEEEEDLYQMDQQSTDLSSDYWQIHKMVKVRGGGGEGWC
ncbi:histone H3.v1-like [Penaeus monodon]|uniref:histone H3.v1-like n=1 Tax=Penaeus monodon TaxID=6687 RepID=UPI0018A6D8A0|nr:histone H3.v1-like [Penaeus monodon]